MTLASVAVAIMVLTAAPGGEAVRAETEGADTIDVLGRFEGSHSGGPVNSVEEVGGGQASASRSSSERYCPPTLYTFGTYRELIFDCDGAGGTELTPVFDREDVEDGGELRAPQREVLNVSREDVQSLLVHSGSLRVQPDQSWVLVNTDTVVMTDATEHTLGTQVLGLDVDVRVTPAVFVWDFGDGSEPVSGTDPGAPWPDHTVSHVYRQPGSATISLRTEWDAAFRVEGTSTWVPVMGRAVTVATSEPIDVVTATPRLTTGR